LSRAFLISLNNNSKIIVLPWLFKFKEMTTQPVKFKDCQTARQIQRTDNTARQIQRTDNTARQIQRTDKKQTLK
jgi:hypothetical protein